VLPLLTRVDHVGIACRDLDAAIGRYEATFGLQVVSLEVNEEQGVREAMLAVGASGASGASAGDPRPGYVQLLEPLGPDTPVGRFLARRGEGLHHVGYGVQDVGRRWPPSAFAGCGCSTSGPGTDPWGRRSRSCTPPIWAAY
jgi:methylmalonyl-CoA/ethylmalonyl-CoA epimerase